MRSLTTLIGVAYLILASSVSHAGVVGSLSIGTAIPNVEELGVDYAGDAGYMVGGSVGWRFGDLFQWDWVETYYMAGDQTQDTGFGQVSYTASNISLGTGIRIGSFSDESKFHPYVSFGIAGSRTSIGDLFNPSTWQWGFEWNTGLGFLYKATPTTALGIRYRYRATSISGANALSPNSLDIGIHTIGAEIMWGR